MAEQRASSPDKYITPRAQRAFTAEERRTILNVYGVLLAKSPGMAPTDVAKRVGELTGCSTAAVERLAKEFDNEVNLSITQVKSQRNQVE